MTYEVDYDPAVLSALELLTRGEREMIRAALDRLGAGPNPAGLPQVVRLRSAEGTSVLRVGANLRLWRRSTSTARRGGCSCATWSPPARRELSSIGRVVRAKELADIRISTKQAEADLAAFRQLLDSRAKLEEREHVLPFFKAHPHLSAYVGTLYTPAGRVDRLYDRLAVKPNTLREIANAADLS